MRPEIQGLRALAVALVVAFHIWPSRLTGGFVGVDVFFVISGFLMTAHLTSELFEVGRLKVTAFWARRIRRLLPAALVVLLFAAVATVIWLPLSTWRVEFSQIVASVFYVQNWALAAQSVDYFALETMPSLVQHYWSLSVEEQFYLVWPILLVAFYLGARRIRKSNSRSTRPVVCWAVLATFLASLALCIYGSFSSAGGWGYFATQNRIWEFCIGALVALVPQLRSAHVSLPSLLRDIIGWVGFLAIGFAALRFDSNTVFPGFAALVPTLGTAAVLVAGHSGNWWSASKLAALRPVQYVGDISYSVYLWHWPLLVLALYWISPSTHLRWWSLGVVGGTLALAALTKRWIEDPLRRGGSPDSRAKRARPFLFAAVSAVAVTAVAAVAIFGYLRPLEDELRATLANASSQCLGAAAMHSPAECPNSLGPVNRLLPAIAANDHVETCNNARSNTTSPDTCIRGDIDAASAVALVGDSHAQAEGINLSEWASEHHLKEIEYTLKSCPGLTETPTRANPAENLSSMGRDPAAIRACAEYTTAAIADIVSNPHIGIVVFTNASDQYFSKVDDVNSILHAAEVEGIFTELQAAGKHVVVLRDVPGLASGSAAPECLETHPTDPTVCSLPRDEAMLPNDVMVLSAAAVGAPLVDLSSSFCDTRRCYSAIGGLVVYTDRAHLTSAFATTLRPYFIAGMDSALESFARQ